MATLTTEARLRLDFAERAVIVALYAYLVTRFAFSIQDQPLNAVYLATEGLVMLLVLFRRRTDHISASVKDWAVAFAGTFLPMLVSPGGPMSFGPHVLISGILLFLGFSLSVWAKLQLRRSFGIVAAHRGLKTSAPYSLIRHPMYLGYLLSHLGFILLNWTAWNMAILTCWICLQLARIHAEEKLLAGDPDFRKHMQRVRYRLLPLVY
jgi:protein-S-isoprenylcysteine O-methyltransferase Ste14